ncbi:hypothetical protein EKK58_04055 [Candidatus Dependentiae bacterium]|nr:MAG: hypothetical protein EKK58_04055 [Candidatus Dependentiae bacterium]
MFNNKCIDILMSWLARHHFGIIGLSGLISGLYVMPKVINSGNVIFDAEFANYTFQIASLWFKCHKMTKLMLPFCLVYAFMLNNWVCCHSESWQIIDKSIGALFFFVSLVDYILFLCIVSKGL